MFNSNNKCDETEKREVSYKEGEEICKKHQLDFFMEVSAKNGFTSPNFMELVAINLVKDYESHLDESEDLADNNNESVMLDQKNNNSNSLDKCC